MVWEESLQKKNGSHYININLKGNRDVLFYKRQTRQLRLTLPVRKTRKSGAKNLLEALRINHAVKKYEAKDPKKKP